MKIISKKNNIQFIRIHNNVLAYISTDNTLFYNDEIVYQSDEGLQELYGFDCYLYTNTSKNGDGVLINIDNKKCESFQGNYIFNIVNDKIVFGNGNETKLISLDKLDDEILKFPFMIYFIYIINIDQDILVYSDHDFFINKSIINIYKLSTGQKIWSFDLKELGTWGEESKPYMIGEFSGIFKSTLVCTLQNGNILLLDLITGVVKYIFENAKIISGLRQKEGPIFWGVAYREFIEVDVEKQTILRQISLEHEFDRMMIVIEGSPRWYSVAKSFFHDGLFYFFGDYTIGILDPIEVKIIDFIKLELTKYAVIKDVQVNGDLIYCLETKGNLTILESDAAKAYKRVHQIK